MTPLAQDYLQLISPKEIVRISHDEWIRDFAAHRRALNDGVIFLVHGNPVLMELYHRFLRPRYERREFSYFRHNLPDFHRSQILQKALFRELGDRERCFVDSYVRLRHTSGTGAFDGPHIDREVELPINSVNCWVSFSNLDAGEALQFLPSRWHGGAEDLSGHFSRGIYLDRFNRLMPKESLLKEAVSHPIGIGEYFVFNSGRMMHCSPFFLRRDRISTDQRVFIHDSDDDANFGEITQYYALSDIDAFTGGEETSTVLQRLWKSYVEERRFPVCELLSAGDRALETVERLGLHSDLLLKLGGRQPLRLDQPTIRAWLSQRKKSVSLRLRLLDQPLTPEEKTALSCELLRLPTRRPSKIYRKMLPFLSARHIDEAAQSRLSAGAAFTALKSLHMGLGRYLPAPLKSRLFEYFSFMLLKSIHPRVTHALES